MQVRRLITLLNQMIKRDPSVAFAQVAVFSKAFKSDYYAVKGISEHDLGVEFMEWDTGMDCGQRKERAVLVFGVDSFRCEFSKP
jgi:hypothetical protein